MVPTGEIEDLYSTTPFSRVGHGDIRGFADGSRFLLESALRIAAIILDRAEDPEHTASLFKRLELGIPAEYLPLTESPLVLTRGELLALGKSGYVTMEMAAALPVAELEGLLGRRGRVLHQRLSAEKLQTGT